MDLVAWRLDVQRERAWRAALYTGPESPLSADAREKFRGLQWFTLDPDYRVQGARLVRLATPIEAGLPATGPDAIRMLDVGRFEFMLRGEACSLRAFAPAPGEADEAYILIPFRDATSGKETYGGGRYLDVEPREDDVYELDFNRAYHPYCAFDDAWACILPPVENRLSVAVEAGERLGRAEGL